MLVRDVMSEPVHTIAASASAREAAALMRARAIRHLVALSDHAEVVGVVSDRDLRAAQPSVLLLRDRMQRENALALLKVRDVMTPHPKSVRDDDTARSALELMRDRKFGALPVMNNQHRLVGIVTGGDVLDLAIRLLSKSG